MPVDGQPREPDRELQRGRDERHQQAEREIGGELDEVCISLVPELFGESVPYVSKVDAETCCSRTRSWHRDAPIARREPGPWLTGRSL